MIYVHKTMIDTPGMREPGMESADLPKGFFEK
jgi:putative ribosome biogenesis GTPase RsgA